MDKRIIIVLFSYLIPSITTCLYSHNYGNLTPDVARVELGHELNFNCSIDKSYIDNGEIDITKVFFTFSPDTNDTNVTQVVIDQKYVKVIDPYTVQLKVPYARDHTGAFYCKFNSTFHGVNDYERTKIICVSNAYVGFKPLEVKDFKCVYYYQQKLLCSWKIPINPIKTQYFLYYHHDALESEGTLCKKMNESSAGSVQQCYWDESTHSGVPLHNFKYHLRLNGNNSLGNITQAFDFDLVSIVRLPPPRNFSYHKGKLSWKAPERIRIEEKLRDNVLYKIYVIDKNGSPISAIEHRKRTNTIEVKGLRPHTEYRFNITCKVDDPSNDNWGDMASITVTTDAEVPYKSPEILDQSFETRSKDSERKVTIYWKDIEDDEKNGPNFTYYISYFSQPTEDQLYTWVEPLNSSTIYPNITLFLKPDVAYQFRIYSQNDVGKSSNYSNFVLPANRDILWNNDSSKLSNKIKVLLYEHEKYKVEWTTIDPSIIENYTMFWCRLGRGVQCVGNINWEFTKSTSFNFTGRDMQFGISHNSYDYRTTGIIWANCLADNISKKLDISLHHNPEPRLSPANKEACEALVSWEFLCEAQRELVEEFIISYCEEIDGCKEARVGKNENNYLIKDLKPNKKYRVNIKTTNDLNINTKSKLINTSHCNPKFVKKLEQNLASNKINVFLKENQSVSYYLMKIKNKGDDKEKWANKFDGNRSFVEIDFNFCELSKNNEEYLLNVTAVSNDKISNRGIYTEEWEISKIIKCPSFYSIILKIMFIIAGIAFAGFTIFFILFYSYRYFISVKQKNDDFQPNIALRDQHYMEEFNYKPSSKSNSNNNNNRTSLDGNNISESSLMESDSATTNANETNNSTNSINSEEQHLTLNGNVTKGKSRSSKNPISKFSKNQFCSSDSGVSDMHHQDNLEYFYNQNQDDLTESLLKKNSINPTIKPSMNGFNGNANSLFNQNFHHTPLRPSTNTSAPSSSLPSPENNHNDLQYIPSPPPPHGKTTYVLLPSSDDSHLLQTSTHLPDSYNQI